MKSKNATSFLALFLGGIGIHRFYLGQTAKGILSLIFFWTYIPLFISIIDFIVFITISEEKFNLKYNPLLRNVNSNSRNEKILPEELVQIPFDNIKLTVTTSSSSKNYHDNSIIDITGQSTRINSNYRMIKYSSGVPKWADKYIYSFSELENATFNQIQFYNFYKRSFTNGEIVFLEGNTNYAFVLMFDFQNEYEKDKKLLKLETRLNKLGECYPATKPYGISILKKKRERDNIPVSKKEDVYSYDNYYEEYWKLGSKYKNKLKLNEDEVKLLNDIYNPSNNFFNIEYCGLEILKLYIAVISALKDKYIQEETTIKQQFLDVADVIARKQFKYRNGSENYKYCIQARTNDFYSHIFKYCENAVREIYGHKRKLNTDNYSYYTTEANTAFESTIISKVTELLPILISKVSQPDEATNIELYSQNTSRWKIKFDELTTNYNENLNEFIDSIHTLVSLNEKNPSVENIFFEASKFISKYDKESALTFYVCYLYCDLESDTFNNKQLTKTIQKSLFNTNEQLHDFEKIISELIKDKDVNKALESVSKIYKMKRKKIKLDIVSIREVQKQHSGTVELLNEYLKDDFEDENSTIKSQEISNEEIQIEITQKNEKVHQSAFVSELSFTTIHIIALELFAKSNFSLSQDEFEVFAKSKGVFKNSLIENINDTCYEFLDDVLIEEEEDYYTINTNYFQKISIK